MAVEHADDAIDSFLELEARFKDFLRNISYGSSHTRVYSPVLAGLLLETGSLTESMLKSAMDNARYNSVTRIADIRVKRYTTTPPYLNINDLRKVFRADMFYAKKVWYIPRGDSSFPWQPWARQQVRHPKWWGAYNHVKHDRFGNIAEGKLQHVMHAMKAAFLVLVQAQDFREAAVMRGIVRSNALSGAQLRGLMTNWEPINTAAAPTAVIVARTDLFGYKFQSSGSMAVATDTSCFL